MAAHYEGGGQVERRILPSAIRRGRMATSPVWDVVDTTGTRWRFQTRKQAAAFATTGCAGESAPERWGSCKACGGWRVP